MKTPAMKMLYRWIPLLAAAMLAANCASSPRQAAPPPADSGLFAAAAGRFLALDPATPAGRTVAASTALDDVGALTYDPGSGRIYGIASSTTRPRLIAVERTTGAVTEIGPIVLPGVWMTRVEGLAWNPGDGRLYAAGGQSKFASNRLLVVDPENGNASEIAGIRGTAQDEADGLVFAGGKLYAVDGVAGSSLLYVLDPASGEASPTGVTIARSVNDLAFDDLSGTLYGTVEDESVLVAVALADWQVTELGPIAGDAEPPTALAFVAPPRPTSTEVFADDFESGSLEAWAGKAGAKPKKKEP